jgi:hypothetical protein
MGKKRIYVGDLVRAMLTRMGFTGSMQAYSELSIRFFPKDGPMQNLGVVGRRCVTTVFCNLLADALQAAGATINTFKYHDSGTGTGDEAVGDTTLGTPCGEARDAGTQVEGATANVYKSVATHTYAGAFAITEHGLFSADSGGTLMDRTQFAAVNVAAGDKIEFTFQLTIVAGG